MDHLTLAQEFNEFAYNLVSNHSSINRQIPALKNNILLRRIVFSRYYYALYHKYLAYDVQLSNLSGTNKHQAIVTKLESCSKHQKLYQIFIKFQNLRVWADYQEDNNPSALQVNLSQITEEVYSIIKLKKISC